jgi:crotonobetainyl-CoA:carnitine CoA-transferase CaiB-like acyl-CoA transferase
MQLRGSFRTVRDGIGGTMQLPVDATRFDPAPGSDLVPLLGEHRDAVLRKALNLSAQDIERLEEEGAFGKTQALASVA